jgi:Uma2 family endonuclease
MRDPAGNRAPEDTPSWPVPQIKAPPTIDELVTDDGVPMESNMHRLQAGLLVETLEIAWAGRDFFAGSNMFLYYSLLQTKKNDFRGPDVFVVLGTEHRDRAAWVVWEEGGLGPDAVIELTSPATLDADRGEKKRIYARVLGVPDYFIFDPVTAALEGYRLEAGRGEYEPLAPGEGGRLPCARLGLSLGVWHGSYHGFVADYLRWYAADGSLLPTPEERAAEETRLRAEEARLRAEEARLRAEETRLRAEEAQRREAAEQRVAALEAELARLRGR